ncbi:MAG: HAD family phosphatase [Phycisphaerae bacterium]|jgi:HAD superfamily hydrolase (TIGR01509 family)|nr:HAD family phosphatase [Phycisphaerae bacterium]
MSGQFGLVFDVDGVVADSEAVNVRATARAFSDILGIDGVQTADFANGIGRGADQYVRAGARSHGRELSEDEVGELVRARQDNFLAILEGEPLPAFGGVLELVTSAMASDCVKVAIATSSTRRKSQAVLSSAGFPYRQVVYVCGDDVSRKKPDPEVFQVACEHLSLAPQQCVVIEDAPDGVQAARAAGCKCIAVTNTFSPEILQIKEPDLIVASLSEVSLDTLLALFEG